MIYTFVLPFVFVLLWSSGYIFVESGLQNSTPLAFLALRFIFACIILSLVTLYKESKHKINIKEFLLMGITGIFSNGIYLTFFFLALNSHVSPGVLAIILGLQPLAIALIIREKTRLIQKVGLVFGLFGLFVTIINTFATGSITPVGVLYAFLALLGITIGTLLQKKYCSKFPLIPNMAIQYFFSALLVSGVSLIFEKISIDWTWNFFVSLFWMVVVMSIITFFLFYKLLSKGKAGSVTSLLYCVPPVTAVLDYLIFKHTISNITIAGMIMVMFSIILIHIKPKDIITISSNNIDT